MLGMNAKYFVNGQPVQYSCPSDADCDYPGEAWKSEVEACGVAAGVGTEATAACLFAKFTPMQAIHTFRCYPKGWTQHVKKHLPADKKQGARACFLMRKNKAGTKKFFINACHSPERIGHSQRVVLLKEAHSYSENPNLLFDEKIDSHARIRNKGSVYVQYPTSQSFASLEVFLPPTGTGGKETKIRNVPHFKVSCFTGAVDDTKLGQAGNWHDVFDNRAAARGLASAVSLTAGWVKFALTKCPGGSTTWRLDKVQSHKSATKPYVSLFELRFNDGHTQTMGTARYPRMKTVQVRIKDGVIFNKMGAGREKSECQGTLPNSTPLGQLLGRLPCNNIEDGDTNSPVVFTNEVMMHHSLPAL